MTITDIIELAHQRTGRKNEGKGINLQSVVQACLQDICMEMRWPWRKKWASFNSVASTASYDLTDTNIAAAVAGDIEEVISIVKVTSSTDICPLAPITDPDSILYAKNSVTTGDPLGYFLEPGTEGTVHLVDTPNAIKIYWFLYWAIPNAGIDSSSNAILLLPSKYHFVLLQYVVAAFWAMLPGEGIGGPNATAAYALYLRQLDNVKAKSQFSTAETREFKTKSSAVRSS